MKKVLSKSQMSLIKGGEPTAWLCTTIQSKTENECDVILEEKRRLLWQRRQWLLLTICMINTVQAK